MKNFLLMGIQRRLLYKEKYLAKYTTQQINEINDRIDKDLLLFLDRKIIS